MSQSILLYYSIPKIIIQILLINICQSCLALFCSNCPNFFVCNACQPSFCLAGWCYSCGDKISNCIACSSCSTCTSCKTKYALNAGKCQLCSTTLPRCATCSSISSCTTCTAPNQMIGTDCCSVAMPFCTGCKVSPSQCDNCISNSYCKQTPALCVSCSTPMPNCVTCSSCSTCTSCISNLYGLNSSTKCQLCSELIPQCVKCSSATVCTQCLAPQHGVDLSSKCQKCPLINPHCITCTSYSYCTACQSTSYAINSVNLCQLCSSLIPNCIKCSSAAVCMQCDPGYAVNPAFKCQLCTVTIGFCATCSSIDVCKTCMAGYNLVGLSSCCTAAMPYCIGCKNNIALCDGCINDQYYMATPISCSLCKNAIPFCATCTPNGTICYSCFQGYIFNSIQHCQKCGDFVTNCGFCNNTPACTGCISNDYILIDPLHCELCGLYIDDCQSCSSNTTCLSCVNDTLAISPTYTCVPCNGSLPYCTNCFNYTACKICQINPDIILTFNLECKTCSQLIPNCLVCQNQLNCQTCENYYGIKYSNGNKICLSCSSMMAGCLTCRSGIQCTRCSLGEIVEGGCSKVIGCLQVDATKPNSPCVRCDMAQFHNDLVLQKCQCLNGWRLAGLHCTNIVGCTRVEKISSGLICVLCDRNKKFLPRNGTCVCQKYYQLNGDSCTQICGDGRRIDNACDDGNKISGDGCSATCKIQYKYLCQDDPSGKSHCVYDANIRLFYFCTYKLTIPNTIQIVFSVRPYISNLEKSNLANIVMQPKSKITINNVYFKDRQLRINITYSQSLQGLYGTFKLVFDKNYVRNKAANVSFPFRQCKGKPLDYQNVPTSFKGNMEKASKYIGIIAFCNLLLGSLATRMIGVETINAIQLIAISQAFAPKYYPTIQGMNGFTNTIGAFQNVITNSTIVDSPVEYQRLNYSNDFLGNSILIMVFQFSSIGLYALLVISEKFSLFQKLKIKGCVNKKIEKYKQFIYQFLIFPSYAGYIFNIIISNFILSYKKIDKTQITSLKQNSSISLINTIIFAMIFNYQWKYLFVRDKREEQRLEKPFYIGIYLSYTLIITLIMQLCALEFIEYKLYAMMGLIGVYLVVLLIYRPYKSAFHNFVIVINQIGILLAFIWLTLQNIYKISRQIQQMLGYSLACYISLVSLLAIIRSLLEIKKKYFSQVKQNSSTNDLLNDVNTKKKTNDAVDDYLRIYYRKNVEAKVQNLVLQNKMLQRYTGDQRQIDYGRDNHIGSKKQTPKYRLRQILTNQRDKQALKDPLREKRR